jgi:hypothetical protein
VIRFDRVVRVALDGVQRGGDQLVQDPRVGRGAVGGDLGRDRAGAQRAGEEPPGCSEVPPGGEQHVNDLAVLVDRPVLCVPITSSTSCHQAIFVDQATDLSLSSDAVLAEVDRLG